MIDMAESYSLKMTNDPERSPDMILMQKQMESCYGASACKGGTPSFS